MEEITIKQYLQDRQKELQARLENIQNELKAVNSLLAIQEYEDSIISYQSEK